MKLGIYLDLRNPPAWRVPWPDLYERRLVRVERAEELGLASVWLSEHHLFEDGYLPQTLTFAAAIAARNSRIRIGTAVCLAPLRPAVQIAEEAAIVDLVSGGRLELGLGAGYLPDEFAAYGASHADRVATLWKRAEEVRAIWDERRVLPPPAQDRPRIWIGVSRPRGARNAGRRGEGLLWLHPGLLDPYREGLVEAGHDPAGARVSGVANILLSDDPARTRATMREHYRYQQGSYRAEVERQMQSDASAPASMTPPLRVVLDDERTPEDVPLPPTLFVLTPVQAAAWLGEWLRDSPVEHVFFWDNIAGMPEDLADRHVELIARELAPALSAGAAEATL
jgi:alkanesulfonate monooxygenase SsuD/methylene tetrahydromethanopterin reductase-like flavin-dependent oxidoreductase (luciferase family)